MREIQNIKFQRDMKSLLILAIHQFIAESSAKHFSQLLLIFFSKRAAIDLMSYDVWINETQYYILLFRHIDKLILSI